MRILHVVQGYTPAIGGTERVIQVLSEKLVARLNQSRPDVLAAHPHAVQFGVPVGFQLVLELPTTLAVGIHSLQFFVLNKNTRRELGGTVQIEAIQASTVISFSERFATLPPSLVAKVNGTLLETEFIAIGNYMADAIADNVGDLFSVEQVLDFGCGLGRVLKPLLPKALRAEFTGFDIDPMMLNWCDYLLQNPRCRYVSSVLDLPDGHYDLIYAISVFTHLDATTDFWLAEIQRLLSGRGKAFLTYCDDTLFEEIAGGPALPDVSKGTKLINRYVAGNHATEGGVTMGTFYATQFWEAMLTEYFNIECTVPRGLFGHRSFTVVSKEPVTFVRAEMDRTYIRLLERQLFDLRKADHLLF